MWTLRLNSNPINQKRGLEKGLAFHKRMYGIVDMHQAVAEIKRFVIEHSLPKKDMALFGIRCPYCGKSDRIRQLESPESLNGGLEAGEMLKYKELWQHLTHFNGSLGVCKFCLNPLKLLDSGKAETLFS